MIFSRKSRVEASKKAMPGLNVIRHGFSLFVINQLGCYKSDSQALPYTLPLRDRINIWYMLTTHIYAEAAL